MADRPVDEWAPPPLSTPIPFPLVAALGVGLRDGLVLFFLWAGGSTIQGGWHREPWFPSWWALAIQIASAVYVVNMLVHPEGRRLSGWIVMWSRYAVLAFVVRFAWGGPAVYAAARAHAHVTGKLTVLLPRSWARLSHADVRVVGDGVIDVSGTIGPRWWRWLFATMRRLETRRGLVWLSFSGALDMIDAGELRALWENRLVLLADPGHSLSLHVLVRPFPPEMLAETAGPVAAEVGELAKNLVRRQLLLAVPASRKGVLDRRLLALLGTGGENGEPGKLAAAGLDSRMLTRAETDELVRDAYGKKAPAMWFAPDAFGINTGVDDPDALGTSLVLDETAAPIVTHAGWQRFRTYAISDMPARVRVGWTHPVTGGGVLANWSVHLGHVPHTWADALLSLKTGCWNALKVGSQRYSRAAELADRTLDLLRTRDTAVWNVSLYCSVPESQVAEAEIALEKMVGRRNFHAPMLDQQKARQTAEPFGRDPHAVTFMTDSHTIAAGWPSSGGIYVPGGLFLGRCARSPEPICWNPYWEGDETSVGCVLGGSGSGKSNLEMLIAAMMMAPHPNHPLHRKPPPVVVAYYKPFNEWAGFVRHFGGQHYRPSNTGWRALLDDAPIGSAPIVAINIIDLSIDAQTDFLRFLSDRVMAVQDASEFTDPLLYIVGEAWLMAKSQAGAQHLQQMALQVRTLGITLLVDSQFADHLYGSSEARDVIRGASMWTLLRLNPSERRDLGELLNIAPTGMRYLSQIAQPQTLSGGRAKIRGRGLISAHGLTTTIQVLRPGFLAGLLDETNPRLRRKATTNGLRHIPDPVGGNGHAHVQNGSAHRG